MELTNNNITGHTILLMAGNTVGDAVGDDFGNDIVDDAVGYSVGIIA